MTNITQTYPKARYTKRKYCSSFADASRISLRETRCIMCATHRQTNVICLTSSADFRCCTIFFVKFKYNINYSYNIICIARLYSAVQGCLTMLHIVKHKNSTF